MHTLISGEASNYVSRSISCPRPTPLNSVLMATSWVLLFAAFVMQEIRVGAGSRASPCGVGARTIGGASFGLEIEKFGADSDKKTWDSALAACRKLGMVCTPKYITTISP